MAGVPSLLRLKHIKKCTAKCKKLRAINCYERRRLEMRVEEEHELDGDGGGPEWPQVIRKGSGTGGVKRPIISLHTQRERDHMTRLHTDRSGRLRQPQDGHHSRVRRSFGDVRATDSRGSTISEAIITNRRQKEARTAQKRRR